MESDSIVSGRQGPELVLASRSPRRAELLRQIGLTFRVVSADVDEEAASRGSRSPAAMALRRARAKAAAVAPHHPGAVVLGADTVVSLGRRVWGKPVNARDAEAMLLRLSGRWHRVFTAIAIAYREEFSVSVEYARVAFRRLDAAEVRRYVRVAEPLDKAGAYAVQGVGAAFIRRIEGEYTTVVGLPLCRLSVMLRPFGLRVP